MDPTSVGVTVGAGLFIALVMQFLKAVVELWLPSTAPLHDSSIRLLAALVGAAGFVGHARLLGPLTGATFSDNVSQGALAGIAAIAAYHILPSAVSGSLLGMSAHLGPIAPPNPDPPAGG